MAYYDVVLQRGYQRELSESQEIAEAEVAPSGSRWPLGGYAEHMTLMFLRPIKWSNCCPVSLLALPRRLFLPVARPDCRVFFRRFGQSGLPAKMGRHFQLDGIAAFDYLEKNSYRGRFEALQLRALSDCGIAVGPDE